MKTWMFLALIAILLVFTNPSYDAHYEKLIEKAGLGGVLVTAFTGFSRQNFVLFSLGACRSETLTFGILGQVFWVGGE